MSMTLLERLDSPGPKRILALDGGGMRGVICLAMLGEVERTLRERHGDADLRLCEYFDLIGGSSTGAIISAALAMGLSIAEVEEMYMEFGAVAFADHGWRVWRRWRSRFDDAPLERQLQRILADRTLGDPGLRTGLCIIAKRADTGSTWRLMNHPNGRYFESNRDILVRHAVRASVAAPYFFEPEAFEVKAGQIGAFVDGGISMANNPGLELFLLATLKGFPFRWPTGADRLMLVSVGTGSWSNRETVAQVLRGNHLVGLKRTIQMLMNDTDWHGQTILQAISDSPTPWTVDREVGDLHEDRLGAEPSLHYLRYNVLLEPEALEELGRKDLIPRIPKLRDAFAAKERFTLQEIGRAAGKRTIKPQHFPHVFDIVPPKRQAVNDLGFASPENVERIRTTADVVIRNLLITQFYHEAAAAMTRFIGSRDVTWFGFGVHASRTVGRRAMRFDSLPLRVRLRLMRIGPMASFLSSTRDAMAKGNLQVFEELAPLAGSFLSQLGDGAPNEEAIACFCESLRPGPPTKGGQELLKVAFRAWYDAAHEPEPERKSQLVLLGNCSAVYHEQQRLQPLVAQGFEVPVLDSALQHASKARGVGPAIRQARPLGLAVRGVWQRIFTRTPALTAYELPEAALGLGSDVEGPAPGIDFPPTLRTLKEPALLRLLEELGCRTDGTDGSAAGNYASLHSRMRFIATVFRCRQQDLGLLAPPFTRHQVEEFNAGRLPTGRL